MPRYSAPMETFFCFDDNDDGGRRTKQQTDEGDEMEVNDVNNIDNGTSDQVMNTFSDSSSPRLYLTLWQAAHDIALRLSRTDAANINDMQLDMLPTHAPTVHCRDYDRID